MISERDKIILRQLVTSPQWSVVSKLAEGLRQEIKERRKVAENEWETLVNTIGDEGQEKGILRLLQAIMDGAQQSK